MLNIVISKSAYCIFVLFFFVSITLRFSDCQNIFQIAYLACTLSFMNFYYHLEILMDCLRSGDASSTALCRRSRIRSRLEWPREPFKRDTACMATGETEKERAGFLVSRTLTQPFALPRAEGVIQ